MASRRNIKYSKLTSEEEEEDHDNNETYNNYNNKGYDPIYEYSPKSIDKIPWKSILLAIFLLSLGCFLLFTSFFIVIGHMPADDSQAFGLFSLGILTFLPGFYETRIAYYSWRGAAGYRFASIPDF